MSFELAGVVDAPHRGRVGHLLRLDEVPRPDLVGRDVHLARCEIDEALDQIGRLGPAGAAIGIDGQRVRIEAAEAEMDALDIVGARSHEPRERRDEGREGREIGAHVGFDVDPEPQDAPFLVERHLGLGDVVASLRIAEEMLGPIADPDDRTADALGGLGRKRIFAIAEGLGAEAAADIAGRDMDLVLRHFQDRIGELVANPVHALAAEMQMVALGARIIGRDDGARLHIVGDEAIVHDRELRHMLRLCEAGIRLLLRAHLGIENEIALALRPDQSGARLQRGLDAVDGRQVLIFDADGLGGVARLRAGSRRPRRPPCRRHGAPRPLRESDRAP